MLALVPVVGRAKTRLALPMFTTVTVCGPSVLSGLPTAVEVGKVMLGAVEKVNSFTALCVVSATYTLPLASTAMPTGELNKPKVVTQLELLHPGVIIFAAPLLKSATYTLPPPSTATPRGELNPPPKVVTQLELLHPGVISFTALLLLSATYTLPIASTATPRGESNPPPKVVTQLELLHPGAISFTVFVPLSEM